MSPKFRTKQCFNTTYAGEQIGYRLCNITNMVNPLFWEIYLIRWAYNENRRTWSFIVANFGFLFKFRWFSIVTSIACLANVWWHVINWNIARKLKNARNHISHMMLAIVVQLWLVSCHSKKIDALNMIDSRVNERKAYGPHISQGYANTDSQYLHFFLLYIGTQTSL